MAPAVPATRPCPRPRPFGAGAVLKGATATLAYAAHQQFDRTYLPPNVGRPFSPLVPDPALMVLDEPTAGMDVEGRRDFWSAIRRDAERGRTVLFATHYLEEADAYADRIILMRQGKIVADGTASEVKSQSVGRSVQASLPGADAAMLSGLPGVRAVEIRGDRVLLQTTDSDAVARYLLDKTPARDLEIVAHNLEDVFLTLTGDGAVSPASDPIAPGDPAG